jgi:glycosyltransferase involved in cell wall biosynthesis
VRAVHAVVPDGIDDPDRPSGGNAYDRRVCDGLAGAGWAVHEHPVPGPWPAPDPAARTALAGVLAGLPAGAVVLVDGLVASAAADVLVPATARLRVVVLLHMPLGERTPAARPGERAVLSAAAAALTTSEWCRSWLLDRYALDPARVRVARPGTDPAAPATGTADGGELLCVAAVRPDKGHDVLLAALATLTDLPWRCRCVGPAGRRELAALVRRADAYAIGSRVRFTGARTGQRLAATYASADALVLATRAESYGMVVTEALAHGLPVLATAAGGLPEALGRLPDGRVPGVLVPPDDADALAAALRRWLTDDGHRGALRDAAAERRASLDGWGVTTDRVGRVLEEAAR